MPWNKEIEQEQRCRLIRQKQAADQLGCDHLGGAGEEGLGEVLGKRGGYWGGLGGWVEAVRSMREALTVVHSQLKLGRSLQKQTYTSLAKSDNKRRRAE